MIEANLLFRNMMRGTKEKKNTSVKNQYIFCFTQNFNHKLIIFKKNYIYKLPIHFVYIYIFSEGNVLVVTLA